MLTPAREAVATAASSNDAAVDPTSVLLEAVPYIGRYAGKTIVLKVGGSLGDEGTVLEDLVWLKRLGINPVVVHGGGALISHWSAQLGLETRFVEGRRYTDAQTLDVVRMVLIGLVNNELVARLNAEGVRTVGLSGVDGSLLQARFRDEELGLVGEVVAVDLSSVEALLAAGYVVVVAPLGSGPGGQVLNINADTAAGDLARELRAEKLIMFTDVPGVLNQAGELIRQVSVHEVQGLIRGGVVKGGMIPKLEACVAALRTVPRAHIIDGRVPHALIRELFTDSGVGTMIVSA